MKKIAIVGLLSACAVGAYAQGTLILFNDLSDLNAPIYSPNSANPTVEVQGDSDASLTASGYATVYGSVAAAEAAVNPKGGQVTYSPANFTPIGGSSYSGAVTTGSWTSIANLYTYGNLFSAQVFALSAGDSKNAGNLYNTYENLVPAGGGSETYSQASSVLPAFSALNPISQYITTFKNTGTSANAGFLISPTITGDPGIPGTGYLTVVTTHNQLYLANNAAVALAAWYNAGGTIGSLYGTPAEILAGASYASPAADSAMGLKVPYGISAVFMDTGLGEPASVNSAANVNNGNASSPTDMSNGGSGGFTSFSLILVPEPSTIALCVLGACAFLARRRK